MEQTNKEILGAKAPSERERITLKVLIVLGVIALVTFIYWFFSEPRVGYAPLFWLLTVAMIYKLLKMVHEWYHYYNISVPEMPYSDRQWKVDMLTTFCAGEPYEMIEETLKAMVAVRYPHTNFLCDEADDPYLKSLCESLGVVHVTRIEKINAKAGNINNALKQATGEICVVLDPDHIPHPEFLHRVLPYFEDEAIGFVQCVQAYKNHRESLVAFGAAEQTYHFYGPMMMCMNSYGTVQAIGANCTFRRKALDSIGGHAAGLSEDMHTAMELHAQGWKSCYVPEVLTKGLVPSSLSAYYKQQLKWSRGTFDLLFYKYFPLFSKFTWRQKIHYFSVPLYFLGGAIDLLNIVIPIVSLTLSEFPWMVDLTEFAVFFMPMFMISLLIRQYSQRWLMERHEKGFHLIGGLLRTGTWWVYLIGFIYTIFRIKVPYIPTPKDDKPQNEWKLILPNIFAAILSLGAVYWGLSKDWTPYTFVMAGFACTNFLILSSASLMGQQKLMWEIHKLFTGTELKEKIVRPLRIAWWFARHSFYDLLRRWSPALGLVIVLSGIYYYETLREDTLLSEFKSRVKNTGGFYAGIYFPDIQENFTIGDVKNMEETFDASFGIVSLNNQWGSNSIADFPHDLINLIYLQKRYPLINWEPYTHNFEEFNSHPELNRNRKVMAAITDGLFDDYITAYAKEIARINKPVFIRFAPGPDNQMFPWSEKGGNSSEEFKDAWRYIVKKFRKEGVNNVAWIWNVSYPKSMAHYYPGKSYVDWIGVPSLNYGLASPDREWRSFEKIYKPFRHQILANKGMKTKPVMLTEFGCTGYGGSQSEWLEEAVDNIKYKFPEIKSLIIYHSNRDKCWLTEWRPDSNAVCIDWTFKDPAAVAKYFKRDFELFKKVDFPFVQDFGQDNVLKNEKPFVKASSLKGDKGDFQLMVDGEPFYVKGVAYNTGNFPEDGHVPLIRSRLIKDFNKIKSMGANTIRRYGKSVYDRNILNVAEEADLKVIYGFWFDPKVDYYSDTVRIRKYLSEIRKTVRDYQDKPALLGWALGGPVWNELSKYYQQPYLSLVRKSYLQFMETAASELHKIDSVHPAISSFIASPELVVALKHYHQNVPSVDVTGISVYKEEYLASLDNIVSHYDSGRPYMLMEFGMKAYEYEPEEYYVYEEDSDVGKGERFYWQWIKYIEANKGSNLGGIAFCWRDTPLGIRTWFGITDYKDRVKSSYFELKKVYTKTFYESSYPVVYIDGPKKNFVRGGLYKFQAGFVDDNQGLFKNYEWRLVPESDMKPINSVLVNKNPAEVTITLPDEPGKYRLYLYVADDYDRVVATSKAIYVY